ncbi:hypothetical protein [uncultured Roseobacter sp.]|uniref:hypothetical protein n=1 Tax=uncultured Roseobacter sp. TaxID=114847 RepID=UPI00260B8656|nr:hypothetical protein [uncultured Roseobacter sp.]
MISFADFIFATSKERANTGLLCTLAIRLKQLVSQPAKRLLLNICQIEILENLATAANDCIPPSVLNTLGLRRVVVIQITLTQNSYLERQIGNCCISGCSKPFVSG